MIHSQIFIASQLIGLHYQYIAGNRNLFLDFSWYLKNSELFQITDAVLLAINTLAKIDLIKLAFIFEKCFQIQGTYHVYFHSRRNLYIWSFKNGELVKVLDAHFGRIISLEALTVGHWNSVSEIQLNESAIFCF